MIHICENEIYTGIVYNNNDLDNSVGFDTLVTLFIVCPLILN